MLNILQRFRQDLTPKDSDAIKRGFCGIEEHALRWRLSSATLRFVAARLAASHMSSYLDSLVETPTRRFASATVKRWD